MSLKPKEQIGSQSHQMKTEADIFKLIRKEDNAFIRQTVIETINDKISMS